jgi:hypothetical protein
MQVDEHINGAKNSIDRRLSVYEDLKFEVRDILEVMENIPGYRTILVSVGTNSWEIHFSADKKAFLELWRTMRNRGWNITSDAPPEQVASWGGCWRNSKFSFSIWTMFTSTICRLVKDGEETITRPKYKVVCE